MNQLKKIFLSLLIVIGSVFITACGKDDDNGKQGRTPVYQGMVLSGSVSETTLSSMSNYSVSLLDNDKEKNPNYKNGHYYHDHHGCEIPDGGHAGDSEDRNETINPEDPFEDNKPSIEDKLDEELVIGSKEDIYYASVNEDIYVTIKLSNPDNYEIMSFTLNEKKYSNYMFEDGSDMENLILKVNVGSQAGIKEYTIDAIKYIDGTEIKDVIMDGDKTVKAGVRTSNMVTTNVSDPTVTLTSLSFDLTLSDGYSLIEKSNGDVKVILYDGNTIVDTRNVNVGNNEIEFTGLTSNTLYQYAVAASYDDLSGNGKDNHILYKDAFYTNTIVLFTEPTITQTSITWNYAWDESLENKTLVRQELYLDDEKVRDVDVNSKTINDLLSNRAYTIKTTYKNLNNENEVINLYFVTQAKVTPVVKIVDVTSTQTSINFDIEITDTDNVGELTKLELLHGNDEPIQLALDQRTVTGLLSNNEYTIVATYTYDLNDGTGSKTLVINKTYPTLSREVTVTGIDVLNTTSPKVGEEVHVRISLDNPDSIEITDFYINGTITEVVGGNRLTTAVLKFIPDMEGGEYEIELSKINYVINGINVEQNISSKYIESIIVLGKLSVLDVVVPTNNYNYLSPTEKVIKILLNNPTKYDVTEIEFGEATKNTNEITMSENKDYLLVESPGTHIINISKIKYGIKEVSGEIEVSIKKSLHYVNSSEIIEVSTPEELANMTGHNIYKLKNDIDLANFNWIPYPFHGVLLGDNHKISNLTIVVENELETRIEIGLFEELRYSAIYDIKLLDIYISANTLSRDMYVGGITGIQSSMYYATIKNVELSGDIHIVNESDNGDVIYVGSVVGEGVNMFISNVTSSVNISCSSKNAQIIVGEILTNGWSNSNILENCVYTGVITKVSIPKS